MSRIKGRYVATVIIEWDMERTPNMVSVEQMKDNARFLSQSVVNALKNDFKGAVNIEAHDQYCDFYEVEEEHE